MSKKSRFSDYYTYHNDNYTAYVGGHFEVKEGRFTKHYFNGAERLASKIGVGTLDNSAAKGYYQAGGLDYAKRYADAYKDFKQIAKEQGLPPGPPNLKFIYAQQALADERANQETVSDLTLLNDLSLAEWQQQNTEKDPGPPVCEPPFCNTGGDINSGTLPETEVYFFHPDHLGSTSYITNIAGETVQFNSYLPFGESFVSQKRISVVSNYLFNSKEVDTETGLYYYGARYYNSRISTWLSVDPMSIFKADGQMLPYSYVRNNPLRYIDPNGLWEEDADGNRIAEKGDSAGSYAKQYGVSQSEAQDFLSGQGYGTKDNGNTNINPGDVVRMGGGNTYGSGGSGNQQPSTRDDVIATLNYERGGSSGSKNSSTKEEKSISEATSMGVGILGGSLNKAEILIKQGAKGGSISDLRHVSKTLDMTKSIGRKLGLLGLGLTAIDDISSGNLGYGTAAKLTIGGALLFASAPISLSAAAIDIGTGIVTGKTATDHIGDYVNDVVK